MAHCKVYAQVRFGEKPVLVFETKKSARFGDRTPSVRAGQSGRHGSAKDAANSYADKLREEAHCHVIVEEEAEEVSPVQPKEGEGKK